MARSIETPIATRTNRLKLVPRGKPYSYTPVDPGISVGYRRLAQGDGTWIVRVADGKGGSQQKALDAVADDYQDANGANVLTFMQAAAAARTLMRGDADTGSDGRRDIPITIAEAVIAYRAGLHDQRQATRVLGHLPAWLANMPAANAKQKDFRAFATLLAGKGLAPSSVKRTCKNFAAAMVQAAKGDERITNRQAWRDGFEIKGRRSNGVAAVNYATDAEILSLVAACYEADAAIGLFVDVGAQAGSRPIQIARLQVASLRLDNNMPRLMMPAAFKGQKDDDEAPVPVPVTHELAERLRKAAHGRRIVEPLLLQKNGEPWCYTDNIGVLRVTRRLSETFADIAKRLGLPPDFSFYGLRHSSIIRQLQDGVSPHIVAKAHDTSVEIIEKHYGSYILDVSDQLIRRTLLATSAAPATGNVVSIRG